jgi:hypothetical protein
MTRLCWTLFIAFATIILVRCKNSESYLFTRLDKEQTGIKFQNTLFEDGPLNVANYIYFYNGAGVAIGDINNDGLQDILFTGNMVRNRLYLNKGNFLFEDISPKAGIAEKQGWCTGATMADVNGDGKLDIYICRSADGNPERRKNLLFINNGDLTFTERAGEYGLADPGYSTQASFFDYDKDGDLDCYIINHSSQKYSTGVQQNPELRNEYNPDFANKLYRNDGGDFTDVSKQAGIVSNVLSFGLGVATSDVNNDGWPDVYVSNDFNEPDYLFINNKNGTFTESLSKCMDEVSLFSMGSDAADFNNDGLIDIVSLDMLAEDNFTQKMHSGAENFDKFQYLFRQGFYFQYNRNMLQRNNGDGTFSEVGQLANVSNTDWSWSALFSDFDNDGYKDLFVTNGYVKDFTDMDFMKYSMGRLVRSMHGEKIDNVTEYISKMPTLRIPNYIFQNSGGETFAKKTKEWGLDQPGVSAGAAYADLDNDGDLDLVVNNCNDYADIYKNNSETLGKNNFLRVRLLGSQLNERGVGSKVKLFVKGQEYYQEESPVRGFQSSCDPVLDFGIGSNNLIDSLLVIWPNDKFQKLVDVKADQTLTLKIADAKENWTYDSIADQKKAIFAQKTSDRIAYRENPYNDFTQQTLLPNYLSRQGPCIEVADVNHDGLEDFFIGGAKNQPSRIFIQNKIGEFQPMAEPSLAKDSASEDVAAAFFDADGDGDMDLYVGAGGYEFNDNDPALQDRLYVNDGRGNFVKKENGLPQMLTSTGCVKAADVDGDGDLDLFVGSRVVPGKYPIAPRSYILINDGKGVFSDATASVCNDLQQAGMITDAAWVDLNKDGLQDLIVVGEWMPIKVLINQKGKLVDASSTYIHFPSSGWWNRIYATDMDGDGDIDLIVGNCGLNTQFHANEKEPMTLYYEDFDHSGSIDPILCYYIEGVSYPAASLDDLTEQLPSLKKKFLEYKSYAKATINDMFSADQLKDASVLKAERMETVYLENTGDKGFEWHVLPMQAQYAPIYGIVAEDANHDGKKDLILAGNNTWTRIKFGRYKANHGVLLLNHGNGRFGYVPQKRSGLNIRENVRSLKLIHSANGEQTIFGINDGPAKIVRVK